MSNAPITIRTLLVFGICALLAVFLGYITASPFDYISLGVFGLVSLTFAFPLLLRWHHPLLILAWNMNAVVFLLPGRPPFWLFMVLVSVMFSLGHFALEKRARYLSVPSIIYPLLFLAIVILVTAKLTGGIGLGSLGGQTAGGKRYVLLLGAILGYFALTCHQITLRRAYPCSSLFFLGGATPVIGNLLPLINPAFYFIFYIFPPEESGLQALGLLEQSGITRLGGVMYASLAIFSILLACYGIGGVFDISSPLRFFPFRFRGGLSVNKPWRLILFLSVMFISLLGGFRSIILIFALTFAFQFYYEKLFRSRLFPTFLVLGILASAIALPMANRLPLPMQRSLSVLPFVEVDPVARQDAEGSSDWRIGIWKRVLPEIPQYLLLGKGYALKSHEVEILSDQTARGQASSTEIAILSGDYHSGPLSLIMPLGIFGVIGFLWFIVASIKVLFRNYRYGDPALLSINRFLLAYFIARTIFFFTVFGSLFSDMALFTGIIGLSVSLNGGMRTKKTEVLKESSPEEITV